MRKWFLNWLGISDNVNLIPKLQLLLMVRDKEQAELIQRVQQLEDSRKAQWDALIELERKVTADRDRTLALERKAEDSGRIQAGGGVNRMRALISEQGGVKDGMLPTGVVR